MKFIIDTHCWLWWLTSPDRLSRQALNWIADPKNTPLLSAASAWEMAIKYQIGKLKLPSGPADWVPEMLGRYRFSTLEVHTIHALETASLPLHHRDPFDRLLIAQALVERIPILSSDEVFDLYSGVERLAA